MKNDILSPLTGKPANVLKTISTKSIIAAYMDTFNYDASNLLARYDEIFLCLCVDTNYKFYYPFDISGDSKFYEFFQKFDWYYMPWKWEHEIATDFIFEGMRVLEIGCAKGDFIKSIIEKVPNVDFEGLELNSEAASQAIKRGLKVHLETIQNFSKSHKNQFDVVCSFQVLEHIAETKSFIDTALNTLKQNGKFIVCVPNNDSFIKRDNGGVLNLPPHHMGLWGEQSLKKLIDVFPLYDCQLILEPLQKYHYDWFVFLTIQNLLKSKFLTRVFFQLIKITKIDRLIISNSDISKGHSIIAVYKKI
jgi:2-polyprenyl-3-methyl-5-hydroxy-6-metoxy-1,4-benzoquinol methylase